MKFGAVISLWLALAGIVTAGQQVRVTLRVIEVPHAQVKKWTGGAPMKGWQLHDEAVKLALAGDAEIVETNVVTAKSGQKALVESIAEMISPTEYYPEGLDQRPVVPLDANLQVPRSLRPFDFTSFETRNTGVTLEIEPTVDPGGKRVDLRMALDMVDRASLTTWTEFRDKWGDASVRMPVYDSKRFSNSIPLFDGVFELWNVFNARPVAVPAVTTRMMVFVCADVLPTGSLS